MSTNGDIVKVDNYIGGKFAAPSDSDYLDVSDPSNLHTIGKVGLSTAKDVNEAVSAANAAFPAWSSRTMKARAAIVSDLLSNASA